MKDPKELLDAVKNLQESATMVNQARDIAVKTLMSKAKEESNPEAKMMLADIATQTQNILSAIKRGDTDSVVSIHKQLEKKYSNIKPAE